MTQWDITGIYPLVMGYSWDLPSWMVMWPSAFCGGVIVFWVSPKKAGKQSDVPKKTKRPGGSYDVRKSTTLETQSWS